MNSVYFFKLGIGKLSQSDRKAFTDPEVLQRLSSSVSNALEEAKLTFCKDHAEKKSFQEESSKYAMLKSFLCYSNPCNRSNNKLVVIKKINYL